MKREIAESVSMSYKIS